VARVTKWPVYEQPDGLHLLSDVHERVRALETGAHPTPAETNYGWGRNFRGWRTLTIVTGAAVSGSLQWQVVSDVVYLRSTGAGVTALGSGNRVAQLPPPARPSSPVTLLAPSGMLLIDTAGRIYAQNTGVLSGSFPVG
jgi:hypothetical protein